MNDEEKKAIKELTEIKELVEEDLKYKDYEATAILDQIDLESLVIVLNLIENQQKEIEKKDKIINEIKNLCKEELGFERRLKRDNVVPDLFNQGKFYICDNVLNMLEENK